MTTPTDRPSLPSRLMGRANLALLWMLGIPVPILLLIWLFRH